MRGRAKDPTNQITLFPEPAKMIGVDEKAQAKMMLTFTHVSRESTIESQ